MGQACGDNSVKRSGGVFGWVFFVCLFCLMSPVFSHELRRLGMLGKIACYVYADLSGVLVGHARRAVY